MKFLKAFFAVFFVLFSVGIINAQFASSCFDGNGDFGMQITPAPSASGQACFDVTVNYTPPTPPKGSMIITNTYELFVKRLGYVQTSTSSSFSTLVCYPANFPHAESVIVCGVNNGMTGLELCRDGCTVIIEP